MATEYKIMMIGGRRCGKTTILSKIKQHFNNVLQHEADDIEKDNLLRLLAPTGEITKLNNAQECINNLFSEHNAYDEFPIDENANSAQTTTTFDLNQLQGSGSLSIKFTDIPGEWCSYVEGVNKENHMEDVKTMIIDSSVIIMAIDTPSLFEADGRYADYYNRINDIKELFKNAFSGETFSKKEAHKMILFVPMKCEKYVIKDNGNVDIEKQKDVCNKVNKYYKELIDLCKNYKDNLTLAILPIVTIKEIEWARYFALNKNTGETSEIYDGKGLLRQFSYGNEITLNSKYRFKPELYDDIADGNKESQSINCEQPLIYALVFIFKYYTKWGKDGFGKKIIKGLSLVPIIGGCFRLIYNLFKLFDNNKAYEKEITRLSKKKMLRERNGFMILQNPLGI